MTKRPDPSGAKRSKPATRTAKRNGAGASVGKSLLAGLKDLRDTLRAGERLDKKYTVRTVELEFEPHAYTAADIKKLRSLFNSSQSVFADLIGVEKKTLQAWEQSERNPPKIARRMFDMMMRHPTEWLRLLKEREPAGGRREEL